MSILSIFVTMIFFNEINVKFIRASEGEDRLVHYLFSEQGYNPLIRPTQHSNETVVVAFGLLLVQLIHVGINSKRKDEETLSLSLGL